MTDRARELRERLAAKAHGAWRVQYNVAQRHDKDYLNVPYDELTEEWKDYDRTMVDVLIPEIESALRQARLEEAKWCRAAWPHQIKERIAELEKEK